MYVLAAWWKADSWIERESSGLPGYLKKGVAKSFRSEDGSDNQGPVKSDRTSSIVTSIPADGYVRVRGGISGCLAICHVIFPLTAESEC